MGRRTARVREEREGPVEEDDGGRSDVGQADRRLCEQEHSQLSEGQSIQDHHHWSWAHRPSSALLPLRGARTGRGRLVRLAQRPRLADSTYFGHVRGRGWQRGDVEGQLGRTVREEPLYRDGQDCHSSSHDGISAGRVLADPHWRLLGGHSALRGQERRDRGKEDSSQHVCLVHVTRPSLGDENSRWYFSLKSNFN